MKLKIYCLIMICLMICLIISGCAVLELTDMLFDDDCQWRGTVEDVIQNSDSTTVTFEDGPVYTCEKDSTITKGDWIEVRRTESGCKFDD